MEVISCPSASAAYMIVFTGTMTLNPVLFCRSTAEAFTKEPQKTPVSFALMAEAIIN